MKEKTKLYLKRMGFAYILAIIALVFKIYMNNKVNNFYTLTPETLKSGTYAIYDDNINKVGEITIENKGKQLIISIMGKEIKGEKYYTSEKYVYNEIDFNRLEMNLKKYEDENYYYYDTGESIVIICLLRSWFTNYSTLEKLSKKIHKKTGLMKNRQTFMLVESDYNLYKYALTYKKPTIQNYYTSPGGTGQLYRCFFIQDDL